MTLYLRQAWRDPRFSFPSTSGLNNIRVYFWDNIWLPDTFIMYERNSIMYERFMKITSTGDIWYVMK